MPRQKRPSTDGAKRVPEARCLRLMALRLLRDLGRSRARAPAGWEAHSPVSRDGEVRGRHVPARRVEPPMKVQIHKNPLLPPRSLRASLGPAGSHRSGNAPSPPSSQRRNLLRGRAQQHLHLHPAAPWVPFSKGKMLPSLRELQPRRSRSPEFGAVCRKALD